jgi:hypothetical protein
VGRTLLSDAFDVDFDFDLVVAPSSFALDKISGADRDGVGRKDWGQSLDLAYVQKRSIVIIKRSRKSASSLRQD